ncbi:MAG: hypothetical protein KC776_04610 [Myxococcales bacterium]|nr:hypothetical protein [Myxococcales bacterium]MCB9578181.1 hypothetical protein [Polyangiaceae bacterium]
MSHSRQHPYGSPPEVDELEELGDDAIVAQQSAAHAPQPRVNVAVDQPSVVVAEHPEEMDPSEVIATRQMNALPGTYDPTMVIRRPYYPPQAAPRASWLPWVIWGIAGLLAFAFGGLLALLSARGSDSGQGQPDAPPVSAPNQ